MSGETALGYVLAFVSLICGALFQVFPKTERVKSTNIHHVVFNLYFLFGCILFSGIVAIYLLIANENAVTFTVFGMISGILIGIAGILVWTTLSFMGISQTSAVIAGTASVTGVVEGIAIGDTPKDVALCLFAILLILIGILGIGFNEPITNAILKAFCKNNESIYHKIRFVEFKNHDDELEAGSKSQASGSSSDSSNNTSKGKAKSSVKNNEQSSLLKDISNNSLDSNSSFFRRHNKLIMKDRAIGVAIGIIGGIVFGSIPFWEEFTSNDTLYAYYLPSFCVGVIVAFACNAIAVWFYVRSWKFDNLMKEVNSRQEEMSRNTNGPFYWRECLLSGVCAGMIWNFGLLCTLIAEKHIGYEIAMPIRESSLALAALIGVMWFKEVVDVYARLLVFACVAITVVGLFLLVVGMYD